MLELTVHSQYALDKSLLGKPITTLARMAGLRVDDVYNKLLPELDGKDLSEVIRYADIALKYASIVDRNRLREEVGENFINALDKVINIVYKGLESKDNWIKRKAMLLHGELIDEHTEKKRFIETIMVEDKIKQLNAMSLKLHEVKNEIAVI